MIVIECGQDLINYREQFLDFWFADMFSINLARHPGPVLHGWPQSRIRTYGCLVNRSAGDLRGSWNDFQNIMGRTCETDADV